MDTNVKHHAREVIDTLYSWLFDGEGYTAPAPAGQCVKTYVDGDEVTSSSIFDKVLGSIENAKGRYSSLQDHAIAVVTSAASAVSTIVAKHNHISAATTGIPGQGHVHRHSTFFDNGRATDDANSVLSFFQSFYDNPSSAFDDLLGHHYPHFDSLIAHLGIDELAKSLNADPRILFLAFLLPLIVLLLSACCIMGAGYSTKEPHGPGYHEDKKKSDPPLVGGKSDGQGSSSPTSNHAAGSSSGSSSYSKKGGKGKGKKGGVHDDVGGSLTKGSAPTGSQLGNNNNVASWASILGATGFRGADDLDFKPFDIHAAMEVAGLDRGNRASAPKLTRHGSSVQGEGIVFSIMEDIIGSTEAQHDQDEIILDNQEDYVENISDSAKEFVSSAAVRAKKLVHDIKEINTDSGHQHTLSQANTKSTKAGPAGLGSEPQVRTRIPRPHSFKEADRHRHQPHIPSSSYVSSPSSSRQRLDGFGSAMDQGHGDQHESIAAKIMDFAQGNPIMKNLDGISGGVLGVTFATVAALANTAEATTTYLKENMPTSISEFFNDLQESFDESMENGGLEGTGFDDQPRVSRVQIAELPNSTSPTKKADSGTSVSATNMASSSIESTKTWPSSYGPMAGKGNKKKSDSSSWDKDIASTASKATLASSTSANSANAGSASTSGEVNKGHAMAANPPRLRQRSVSHAQPGMPAAASSAAPLKNSSSRPAEVAHTSSTEDISESAAADASPDSPAVVTVAGSGLDKHTKSTKHTHGASRPDADEEPSDPREIARRAKMAAENEERGKAGPSKTENVAHTADNIASDGKAAANKAKYQAKKAQGSIQAATSGALNNIEKTTTKAKGVVDDSISSARKTANVVVHDVQAKVKDADKTAKKATSDAKKVVDSGLASSQKAKETVVRDIQGKAKQADSATKKAAADTQKSVGSGLASAQKVKDTIVHNVQEKVKEADATAKKVTLDTKKTVESGVSYAQKAKDALVKDAQAVVHDAETTVENTAHHIADQTKAAVESTIALAQHDIEQAEHIAKDVVNSTLNAAQRTKDNVVHAAEDAAHEAEVILEEAVKQGQENVESFWIGTHAAADKAVAGAKGAAKNVEKSVEAAAKNAKKNIDSTVASTQQAKNNLSSDANKAVNKTSKDAEKAADSASDVVHDAEKIGSAAQKNNVAQAAKEVEKKVATNVKSASASAQKAKDAAIQAAQEIHKRAESAVDSAFDAAQKAKADASHVAKEIEKSVDSAKKTIEQGMQAATSSAHKAKNTAAKDLNEAANKAGQSAKVAEADVQETIKAAMEYARKTTNDAPIHSGKAALDSAISSAHKTESYVAQNLKDAAHKASGDAKAALDTALAAAHEVENHHADSDSVHLDAYGVPLLAYSFNTPTHLHHPAEHTHDIKKAFVYGHNSPRIGNKETRFVSALPLSPSSSDPKPELKAAHSAHHAHQYGASGDDIHKNIKAGHNNHTSGEYNFFLNENENDLLDDANADDGGEEDSDDDDSHHQPGRGGRGILSAAPSILQSAKSAASAVATRVADASQQQIDNARHRLSSMVDHMADNLAGYDELDDDEDYDEGDDHDSTLLSEWSTTSALSTSSTHHPQHQSHAHRHSHHHVTVEDATDNFSDVADNVSEMIHSAQNSDSKAAKDVKALEKDAVKSVSQHKSAAGKTHDDQASHSKDNKSHGDSEINAHNDSEGVHAYRPVLSSSHMDKDGFIIVEAPENAHEHEFGHHEATGHHRTPSTSSSSSSSSIKKRPTSHTPAHAKSHSTSSQQHSSAATSKKPSTPPATGLSYSGVVQLHVNKNDHGSQVGITENRSEPASDSLFQNENYEQFVVATTPLGDEIASVLSHGGDQILPPGALNAPPAPRHGYSHHHHQQKAHVLAHHPYDVSVAPRRISSAAPTTTLSLEHGHGQLQGVEHTREAHGGRKAGVKHAEGDKQQLTVDAQGNKAPESGARRDSGFDLLM